MRTRLTVRSQVPGRPTLRSQAWFARKLVRAALGADPIDPSHLTPAAVVAFITSLSRRFCPASMSIARSSLRSFFQRVRTVLEWSIAMNLRDDNPCDRIGPVLGPQNDIVTHRQALPHGEVAAAVETVRSGSAAPAVRLAFEFLVLTAPPRSGSK